MDKSIFEKFADLIQSENIEIYNEFSLQHELGIFLRGELKEYKVQFERNAKYFGITDSIKHEIDIAVFDENKRYAIELKYPLNGQHPEQMFAFIKDIKFMEQLKEKGFDRTYCLTMVEDKNFYSGAKRDGIYSYFRDGNEITGVITKPTGKRDETICVNGKYHIDWKPCGKRRYYIVEI